MAINHLEEWMGDERLNLPNNSSSYTHKDPLGVVLILGKWSCPLHLSLDPLIGAIAAGNCVIWKPSEFSTATSAALGRLTPQYLDNVSALI